MDSALHCCVCKLMFPLFYIKSPLPLVLVTLRKLVPGFTRGPKGKREPLKGKSVERKIKMPLASQTYGYPSRRGQERGKGWLLLE